MADDGQPDGTPQDDLPGVNRPWDAGAAPPPSGSRPPGPPPPPRAPARRPPTNDEIRTWAILAHASAYIGAFFALAFVGPLVVWIVRRDVDEISALHAKEALNFNLSVLLYGIVSGVAILFLIGIPMLIALGIFWFVNVLRAIIKVSGSESFAYPMTIRFIK